MASGAMVHPCEFFDFWDDTTNAPNDGDFRLGEAEDYLFTVVQSCDAKITSLTDGATCGPGAATLTNLLVLVPATLIISLLF